MTIPDGVLITALAGVLGILGGVVTSRLARSAQREMYPAQVIADLRTEVATLRAVQAAQGTEVAQVRSDLRRLTDYAHELRGALDEAGEDVPPWPAGLAL